MMSVTFHKFRHPGEGRGPALVGFGACNLSWIPAFAGMTVWGAGMTAEGLAARAAIAADGVMSCHH